MRLDTATQTVDISVSGEMMANDKDLSTAIDEFASKFPDVIQESSNEIDLYRDWNTREIWQPYCGNHCVYVIGDTQCEVLYIGESNDAGGRRMGNYFFVSPHVTGISLKDASGWHGHVPEKVRFIRVADRRQARLLEAFLVLRLDPPLNSR